MFKEDEEKLIDRALEIGFDTVDTLYNCPSLAYYKIRLCAETYIQGYIDSIIEIAKDNPSIKISITKYTNLKLKLISKLEEDMPKGLYIDDIDKNSHKIG